MNDFQTLEKVIVRELSCRLCLCTDVIKLKPMSAEVKRKVKKIFDIEIRSDDNLPKAICHECLQQLSLLYFYCIKVEKTQKFLDFHRTKIAEPTAVERTPTIVPANITVAAPANDTTQKATPPSCLRKSSVDHPHGDVKPAIKSKAPKKKTASELKYLESMPLEEFASAENVDKKLLNNPDPTSVVSKDTGAKKSASSQPRKAESLTRLDAVVILNGKPARQGAALDKQITLFYKMECCICHQDGFDFRSLMKHYKDRHGVPGYVTCCNKKFHYFLTKQIVEHMAYHLQPNIFMCPSCHQNFQTSQGLYDHRSNGGRSEGKILCPRCSERYPTYSELGEHLITHRNEKLQCDYCAKLLKHRHRKKTINHMEDLILCSQCIKLLKSIEKQEKEIKEKTKLASLDSTQKKNSKYKVTKISGDDDDESTD